MPSIGPYELRGLLGKGGMGEVWDAVHASTGLVVALKVLTTDEARRDRFAALFRREVRAQAAMDHPGIAAVLDLGELEGDVGDLRAGSPFVALERASGGSLDRFAKDPRPWTVIHGLVLELLEALGHCHARGVVHRDLKPANVLLCTDADTRPGLKLTDFGIAHLSDRTAVDDGVIGTVAYMAPEQALGSFRQFGPWTDLYALGCLTWKLLTGQGPFGNRPAIRVMRAHIEEPIPPLRSRVDVPEAVEPWLRRLLAKDPRDRFVCAADAARALGGGARSRRSVAAPPPRGIGLGLFGLRAVPLVGREVEREQLWSRLTSVIRTERSAVVVLSGPSGTGKSRLAEWLAVEASESGAAAVAQISCDAADGPLDAVARLVRRTSRADGLAGDELVRHFASSGADAAALAEIVSPSSPPRVRLDSRARHHVVARWLHGIAGGRPLVLRVDDVHWSPDAIDLVETLVESASGPVLVLVTARDEALALAPSLAQRTASLGEALVIAPLPAAAVRRLVQQLLGLDAGLQAELATRCGGNPLFAVQLVRGLVERGQLVPGPSGFSLAAGGRLALPDDLADQWTRAVDDLLTDLPDVARSWLERAATLGQEVDAAEWADACDGIARAVPLDALQGRARLVDRLLTRRLALETERGFTFVHGMLREAIEHRAVAMGRAVEHHTACGRSLAERAGSDPARAEAVAERVGRHLIAAGTPDAAVAWLLLGAEHRARVRRIDEVLPLLAATEGALAGASPADPRWPLPWLMRARVLRNLADLDGADAEARRAQQWASEHRDLEVRDKARFVLGTIARQRTRYDLALAELSAARDGARMRGDQRLYAQAVEDIGRTWLLRSGPTAEARVHWEEAARIYASIGDRLGAATSNTYFALHVHREGDLSRATALTRAALDEFTQLGDRFGASQAHDQLADFARAAGDWDTVAAEHALALHHAEALGQTDIVLAVLLHVGAAQIERGAPEVADAALADAIGRSGDRATPMIGMVYLLRATCAALTARWSMFDVHLDAAVARLGGLANPAAARACERAAAAAEAANETERAHRAWALAISQWERFGRVAEAEALRRKRR